MTSVGLFTLSHTYQDFVVTHKGCKNDASGSKPEEPGKLSSKTSMKQHFIALTPTQVVKNLTYNTHSSFITSTYYSILQQHMNILNQSSG